MILIRRNSIHSFAVRLITNEHAEPYKGFSHCAVALSRDYYLDCSSAKHTRIFSTRRLHDFAVCRPQRAPLSRTQRRLLMEYALDAQGTPYSCLSFALGGHTAFGKHCGETVAEALQHCGVISRDRPAWSYLPSTFEGPISL